MRRDVLWLYTHAVWFRLNPMNGHWARICNAQHRVDCRRESYVHEGGHIRERREFYKACMMKPMISPKRACFAIHVKLSYHVQDMHNSRSQAIKHCAALRGESKPDKIASVPGGNRISCAVWEVREGGCARPHTKHSWSPSESCQTPCPTSFWRTCTLSIANVGSFVSSRALLYATTECRTYSAPLT